MNIFQRIANLFSGRSTGGDKRYLPVYVLSRRCNEPIAGQVDLQNELSISDEDENEFFVRKVLHTSGERRCFDQVELNLWFGKDKQLLRQEVMGGQWLEKEVYARELARFNAPPEESSGAKETS